MLLPLIVFLFGIFLSSLAGLFVISIHSKWKISVINLVLFVVGSFTTVIIVSLIYGKLAADKNGSLQTKEAVIMLFVLIITSIFAGGIVSTYLGRKLFRLDK